MPMNHDERENLIHFIQSTLKSSINISSGWRNFSENITLTHALVLDIDNIPALQALLRYLYQINQTKRSNERIILRVAAGGRENEEYSQSYSFTPVVEADIVIRLTGKVFREITPTNKPNVINAGPSVQIGELDSTLYEEFDLVLPTSSLIPYVTVAGLADNAGHGSGINQPSFSGLIEAITFCLPNGEIVRLDRTHQDFEIIRAAYFGLFGIVLNVELRCMEAKKLQCITEARSIPEFIGEIKKGLFFNDPYVSVMYVPTYQSNELTTNKMKNVIIYRWRPVEKGVNDVNNGCPILSRFWQEVEIKLQEGFRIPDLLRQEPSLTPYFMKYFVSKLKIGKKDTLSVAPWPTIHYQTSFPRDINDVDYLFEVSPDSHEIVEAVEKLVKTLTDFSKKHKQYPVPYAAYLRVFGGTNGGLSTSTHQTGKYICGFDIVSSPMVPGYDQFREEMDQFFLNTLHAKPHWGKYLPEGIDYEKLYGNHFVQFLKALTAWYDEHGMALENSMLLNPFACQVLKLPFAPTDTLAVDNASQASHSTACANDLAKEVLPHIQGEEKEALELRKKLNKLASTQLTASTTSLFEQPTDPVSQPQPQQEAKQKKRRCLFA